jgi:DNA-binding CsgD family transcriptional regulator/tetratricopeptide (TPR) repeat protein
VDGFVGRQHEVARVLERAVRARDRRPSLVLVEGESGIGKTSLLRRVLHDLGTAVVLEAAADESEHGLRYGLLDQLVRRLPQADDFPLLDAREAPPYAVGAELLALTGRLQDDDLVVLALEDVHWADAASVAAVGFMVRRLRADAVLVLATSRPGPAADPWRRLAADPARGELIELAGLTQPEVRDLARAAGGHLAPTDAAVLHEHTGGHPVYLRAVLAELPPEGLAGRPPAAPSLASVVQSRCAGVPPEGRALLEALATLGPGRWPLPTTLDVAGVQDRDQALDAARRSGLVDYGVERGAASIGFSHPVLCAPLYDSLPHARRRALHRSAAAVLEDRLSLEHRLAAADGSDRELAADLERAARAAVRRHDQAAAGHYLRAAAEVSAGADRERCLLTAILHFVHASQLRDAEALLDRARGCHAGALRDYALGFYALFSGSFAQAQDLLTLAADQAGGELVTPVNSALACAFAVVGRGPDAIAAARRAVASAPPEDPQARQARAFGACGRAWDGGYAAGLAELSDLPDDPDLVPRLDLDTLIARGLLHDFNSSFSTARRDLLVAVRRLREGVPALLFERAYFHLAHAEYQLGLWDDARINAELALTFSEESGRKFSLPMAHALGVYVAAGRGDWQIAERHLADAREAAVEVATPQATRYTAVAAARLARARNDPRGMIEAVEPLLREDRPTVAFDRVTGTWRLLHVEGLLGDGQVAQAAAALDAFESAALRMTETVELRFARMRGRLAEVRGDTDRALRCYEKGLAVTDVHGGVLQRALLQQAHGRLQGALGNRRAATASLGAARSRFAALGATPYLERCDADLAAVGAVTRTGSPVALRLTPREREVAHLVARGLTNREAAAQLFVTDKAVDYHLGNIFAKLGIRSRRQIQHALQL